MKTAETKSTDSQRHTAANRPFFDRGQENLFFSRSPNSGVQAKFAADLTPFFQTARTAVMQRKCAACTAEEREQSDESHEASPRTQQIPATIQAKLTVGKPGDRYEREADRIAEMVIHMPETRQQEGASSRVQPQQFPIQRACSECGDELRLQSLEEEENGEILQTEAADLRIPRITPKEANRINELQGRGQPLAATTRSFFESRFRHDFSQVRVHADARAAESARALNARAFTTGKDIVFASGQYAPGTLEGQRLLAHELTHTVQQRAGAMRVLEPVIQREQQVAQVPSRTAVMARAAAAALGYVGDHYLTGAEGEVPDTGEVTMHPGHPHAAHWRGWICSGKYLAPAVAALAQGSQSNPQHQNSPGNFSWPRPWPQLRSSTIVQGETCEGERHFDCSGLVYHVFSQAGFSVSRLRASAYRSVSAMVQPAGLIPGDLCFTSQDPDHVGIYVGENRVVDAYPGWGVRVTELSGTDLFNGAGQWDEFRRLSVPLNPTDTSLRPEAGLQREQGRGREAEQEPAPPPVPISAASGASVARLPAECEPPSGLARSDVASVDFTDPRQRPCYAPIGSGSPHRRRRRCNERVQPDTGLPIDAYFFPSTIQDTATALVLGGIHGNERPGYEMASAMATELARPATGAATLAYHTIIIPCVNPGGIIDGERCNRWNVDINRNFVPGAGAHGSCACTRDAPLQPETQAVQRIIGRFIQTGRGDRILSGHSVGRSQAGVFVDPNFQLPAMDLARRMVTEGQLPAQWMAGNALPAAGVSCTAARSHLCQIRAYCDAGTAIPATTLTRHPALQDRFVLAWVCLNEFYPTYASDRFGLFPTRGSLGHYMGDYMRQRGPHRLSSVPVITIEAPGTSPLSGRGRPSVDTYLRLIRHFLTNVP